MKLIHIALVAVLAPVLAQAQAPAPGGSVDQACSGEIKTLCPGQTGKAAAECLRSAHQKNPNSISAGCKSALEADKGKLRR